MSRRALAQLLGAYLFTITAAHASAITIWPADDGIRIGPSSLPPPGLSNAAEEGVRLFALGGEVVAFQVAIRSEKEPLRGLTLDIEPTSSDGAFPLDETWVSRFLVVSIPARSTTRNGWSNDDETLAWATVEAKPHGVPFEVADALIPVEWAPTWAPYPVQASVGVTASFWIDIFIPSHTPSGRYQGTIRIDGEGQQSRELPLSIDVKNAALPFRAIKTAVFYDVLSLEERIGNGEAELELWRLLHQHHLTPMLSVKGSRDIERIRPAIQGTAYRSDEGYRGPGEAVGDDLVVLGTYGTLGEPNESSLARVFEMMRKLETIPEARTVFLYAIDERCENARASRWQKALRQTGDTLLTALRIGETCHLHPDGRAADLVMIPSTEFREEAAHEARTSGKWLWIYNGQRPRSGPLMLDASPVDLRVNGWIGSTFEIERWFYWESTFWNDINSGGHGPIDPFASADTFHNAGGDTALGDGLLVYPARQLSFPAHSIGKDSVIPSIRLKNLRRGVQDAGYLALVASQNARLAESIAYSIVPRALGELSTARTQPSWPQDGESFLEARRLLWQMIPNDIELDESAVESALASIAKVRRERRLDRSPDAISSTHGLAVLAMVAAAWAARRASRNRRALARRGENQGAVGDEAKTFP